MMGGVVISGAHAAPRASSPWPLESVRIKNELDHLSRDTHHVCFAQVALVITNQDVLTDFDGRTRGRKSQQTRRPRIIVNIIEVTPKVSRSHPNHLSYSVGVESHA